MSNDPISNKDQQVEDCFSKIQENYNQMMQEIDQIQKDIQAMEAYKNGSDWSNLKSLFYKYFGMIPSDDFFKAMANGDVQALVRAICGNLGWSRSDATNLANQLIALYSPYASAQSDLQKCESQLNADGVKFSGDATASNMFSDLENALDELLSGLNKSSDADAINLLKKGITLICQELRLRADEVKEQELIDNSGDDSKGALAHAMKMLADMASEGNLVNNFVNSLTSSYTKAVSDKQKAQADKDGMDWWDEVKNFFGSSEKADDNSKIAKADAEMSAVDTLRNAFAPMEASFAAFDLQQINNSIKELLKKVLSILNDKDLSPTEKQSKIMNLFVVVMGLIGLVQQDTAKDKAEINKKMMDVTETAALSNTQILQNKAQEMAESMKKAQTMKLIADIFTGGLISDEITKGITSLVDVIAKATGNRAFADAVVIALVLFVSTICPAVAAFGGVRGVLTSIDPKDADAFAKFATFNGLIENGPQALVSGLANAWGGSEGAKIAAEVFVMVLEVATVMAITVATAGTGTAVAVEGAADAAGAGAASAAGSAGEAAAAEVAAEAAEAAAEVAEAVAQNASREGASVTSNAARSSGQVAKTVAKRAAPMALFAAGQTNFVQDLGLWIYKQKHSKKDQNDDDVQKLTLILQSLQQVMMMVGAMVGMGMLNGGLNFSSISTSSISRLMGGASLVGTAATAGSTAGISQTQLTQAKIMKETSEINAALVIENFLESELVKEQKQDVTAGIKAQQGSSKITAEMAGHLYDNLSTVSRILASAV